MSKERIKQLTEEIQLLKKKLRISEQDVFRLAAEKADLQNTIKNLTLNPDPLKQNKEDD
jgi:prefoldin subunit 5